MNNRNKDDILFIGNGLNRVSNQGTAWDSSLDQLAGTPETQDRDEGKIRKEKPFTLWFEELRNRSDRTNLKQTFANEILSKLEHNDLHKQVMSLDMQHILTTNYDYNLEKSLESERSFQKGYSSSSTAKETHYSLFRRKSVGSKYVWHIHGELANIGSIMLGHDQYTGYQHKIYSFLRDGVPTRSIDRNGCPYLSKFARSRRKYKGDVVSWVDLFIERNVHMVGFGLDYTENHLWNLISFKNKLRNGSGMSIGQIKFYRCSEQNKTIADKARLSILESMGVEIINYQKNSYKEAYLACIEDLRSQEIS